MWGVRRDESTRIAQVTNSTEHPLLTVCRSWKPWSPNEWLRCDHVWRPILGASMGHNLQQGLTILTGIMIILCCILQCYVYFCFFCHSPPQPDSSGAFFNFFQGPCELHIHCVEPGLAERWGWMKAENQSKRGPLFTRFLGTHVEVLLLMILLTGSRAVFFFQMTWLVNFSDLHKHLPSGHAWSICIAWIWIQVECREHAERQEAANGNLDFWRCETLLRIMTGCFSIPQVSFLSHQYLWDKIKWCTQWRNFIVTLFGRVVSQTFVFRRFSWIYAIRTSINSMKQKTWL